MAGGAGEQEVKFQVLHTFAFTSDRKRSSVVVRRRRRAGEELMGSSNGWCEESGGGGVILYCKGADNVILERVDPEKNPRKLVNKVRENIAEFTRDGELRVQVTSIYCAR